MSEAHSYWSASKFESLMLCPGKIVMEEGKPDSTSVYAAEGTAAHQVLTWALQQDKPASHFVSTVIGLNERGRVIPEGSPEIAEWTFTVDDDMAGYVQTCIDYAKDLAGADGVIFADERVNYSTYLAVPTASAWGTLDVIVLRDTHIHVIDFKYGRGVEVLAGHELVEGIPMPNPQMALYALGALQAYHGVVETFEHVHLAISQPRVNHNPSEFSLPVDDLITWAQMDAQGTVQACQQAERAYPDASEGASDWHDKFLVVGEKQCKFCKAKATCSKLRAVVAETANVDHAPATPEEFEEMTLTPVSGFSPDVDDAAWLAACLAKADLIEDWVKAIRAEVERRLLAGGEVPGYKVVQGKKGNRAWTNKAEAEELMKSMRLKVEEMYELSLISPTTAEKLAPKYTKEGKLAPAKEGAPAPLIGPRQWPKLKALIIQSEGKPHVAPVSDSRPALTLTPVVDDFTDVSVESFA